MSPIHEKFSAAVVCVAFTFNVMSKMGNIKKAQPQSSQCFSITVHGSELARKLKMRLAATGERNVSRGR